ncbi:hypothetical protein KAJ87_02020 [Candidatus Pacearchaeota archaeon]|nr:hypothetical protein [Candidatus Pacearchaeota archaeon]
MKRDLIFGVLFVSFILISFLSFVSSATCINSDGGKDIYNKGEAIGKKWGTGQEAWNEQREKIWIEEEIINVTDYCIVDGLKAGRLIEYFCYGDSVASESYGPEDGCILCEDGACVDGIPFPFCDETQCERNKVCYDVGEKIGGHNTSIEYCSDGICEEVDTEISYSFGEYCSEEGVVNPLLTEGERCEFDYQCTKDLCINNVCGDHGSVWKRVLSWFRNLFG